MTTIADIAVALGVSKAAVSYALARRRDKVSQALIDQVHATADQLGWRPNAAARSLRRGSFRRLALVLEQRSRFQHLPNLMLAGMLERCAAADCEVVLTTAPEVALRGWSLRLAEERSVDGIALLWDRPLLPTWAEELLSGTLPVVTVNYGRGAIDIAIDEEAGGRLVGSVLAAHDPTRIGWSAYWVGQLGASHRHFSVAQRFAGVRAALGAAPLEAPSLDGGGSCLATPKPVSDEDVARWHSAVTAWLQRERPTAVICYSDGDLLTVAHAALALGMAGQLELAVFADRPQELPGFTVHTLILPQRELGVAVATRLLSGEAVVPVVPTEVVCRGERTSAPRLEA